LFWSSIVFFVIHTPPVSSGWEMTQMKLSSCRVS
jgi:hypothetical protein